MSEPAHVLQYTTAVWSQAGVLTPDTVSNLIHMVLLQFARLKSSINSAFKYYTSMFAYAS